jgi:hypothetical protein
MKFECIVTGCVIVTMNKKDSLSLLNKWYNLPADMQRQFRKFCFSNYANLTTQEYADINNIKRVADSRKDPLMYLSGLTEEPEANPIVFRPMCKSTDAVGCICYSDEYGLRNRRNAESVSSGLILEALAEAQMPALEPLLTPEMPALVPLLTPVLTLAQEAEPINKIIDAPGPDPQEQALEQQQAQDFDAFDACLDFYLLLVCSLALYYIYYINFPRTHEGYDYVC